MQLDALAVRLRPRTMFEAADLGVRLCQATSRSMYACLLLTAIPILALSTATYEVAAWLPVVVIWWAKPWLDRTILFVLSRAVFGVPTTPRDMWEARRDVWLRGLAASLTVRRLSLWRSLTEPVYQLEGFSLRKGSARIRIVRSHARGSAVLIASAFHLCEFALLIATLSLVFWLAPSGRAPRIDQLFDGDLTTFFAVMSSCAYAAAVLFIEPFYVAAGFGMYLNRRVELEAWDVEQEFRHAFAR